MRHLSIYITDEGYSQFMELAKNLAYIKKIDTIEDPPNEVIENIKTGLKEVALFREGKLKTTPAADFLHEL